MSSRGADDAKYRRLARKAMIAKGIDITGVDASHPLDSILNGEFIPKTGAYDFAHQSANRAFGAQLGKLKNLPPGAPVRIVFEGSPTRRSYRPRSRQRRERAV